MRYCDVSFLAPLFLEERTSQKIEAFIARQAAGDLCISHWTRTEFASLLAREVRMGALSESHAHAALTEFDLLAKESFEMLSPRASDFDLATSFIRRFETKLRAGDALHLAIVANHQAKELYTLDEGMLAAARLLKLPASRGIRL